MRFRYTARTKTGDRARGSLEAANRLDAESTLVERGYVAVTVVETSRLAAQLQDLAFQLQRPKTVDIVVFLRQFAVMVGASMPIVSSLRSLVQQTESASLRSIIVDVVKDVESGFKLSDALATHPRVFSNFAVHIVQAGETSGKLSDVLQYLADQAERDAELGSRVRGAMVYPAFILGGLGTVAFIMMTFVVPRLTNVLQETGAKLPLATRMLIAVSSFFASWWWLVGALIVGSVVLFRYSLRTASMRSRWDTIKLRLPIFGALGREVAMVRIAQSFGMLLRGGVDMVPALEVVSGVVGNAAYRMIIEETIREVKDGNSITTVFRRSSLVPSMVAQLLAVGEETGQLEGVLDQLGRYHQRLVEQRIRNLVTIIEPLVMIILGVAVGVMVAAIIMPMYNLASQF